MFNKTELREFARYLYDGGYRSYYGRKQLREDYRFSEDALDIIIEAVIDYESEG